MTGLGGDAAPTFCPTCGEFGAGYRLGYATGFEHGYAQADAAMARAWRLTAQRIRDTLLAPTFAELQRRRGEAS